MNRLFRFKGPPGSGKSTAAKQMLRENPGKMKRINMDLLREMLDDGDFTMQNEKFAGLLKRRLIDTALRRGFDVIDDNTNFSEKGWYETCEIAAAVGDVQVIEKAFIISKKECLTRNAGRPNPVPDHIIHTMFDKHVTGKKVEERSAYFPPVQPVAHDPAKQECIIIDLDGTVALNNGHRGWYEYEKCIDDELHHTIAAIIQLVVSTGKIPLFVSGRDASAKEGSWMWLQTHELAGMDKDINAHLFTRKEDDFRHDTIVKEEIYREHIEPFYNVFCVFDDRTTVVDMWRALGLVCLAVGPGDF